MSAPANAPEAAPRVPLRALEALRRRPATTAAAIVALVAVAEVAAAGFHAARVASRHDFAAAAAEVRAGFRDGDLVVFAPDWIDPVGRMALGDLIPIPVAGRMDSDRYARVWEVSLHGRDSDECRSEGAQVTEERWHGAVRVRLCRRQAPAVLYDFVARAMDANAEDVPDGKPALPCTKPAGAGRLSCPIGDPLSNWVGPTLGEIDYRPRYCVWAHPIDGGALRVSYPAVPLGATLVGWAGIADFDARHMYDKATGVYRSPPADLSVAVAGRTVATLRSTTDTGGRRFVADTSAWAGTRQDVVFTTRAPEGATLRQLCFAAEARDR